uniref:DUF4431 domain-containing protein n=1 Tax=Solibacter usitatus (strain Ellin6076) TaxID=234267 RepID=Q024R4_SOLUE
MSKYALLQLLFMASSFGQNCIQYGTAATVSGRLSVVDESGYNQFIALNLQRPICTTPDSRKGLEWERGQTGVRVIQAGVYGSDDASEALRDRLNRLVGHSVTIKGALFPAQTGYHRTDVQLGVEAVNPLDSSGRDALQLPPVPFKAREVAAYDVTVNAGKRLVVEAREARSEDLLIPGDKYVTHWMTGGEVLYVNCLDGYDRKLISTTEKDGGICFDGDLCGLSAFPKKPVIIRFRCTKKP